MRYSRKNAAQRASESAVKENDGLLVSVCSCFGAPQRKNASAASTAAAGSSGTRDGKNSSMSHFACSGFPVCAAVQKAMPARKSVRIG